MERLEAPKKIYIPTILAANTVRYKKEGFIEYVRTDAFIEKACDWLRNCLNNGLWIANDVGETEKEVIIEHFKEAMKL